MPILDSIEFRSYQPEDLAQVLALERTAFGDQELYGRLVMNLEDLHDIPTNYFDKRGDFLVGLYGEEVVTMGGLRQHTETCASVGRMRTQLELQGEGLGRRMLTLLEARAIEIGYTSAVLSTSVEQHAARRLYETNGYTQTHYGPYGVLEVHYRKDLRYRIQVFDARLHDSSEIASLHLKVREEQVASGQNSFADILDSQEDLGDIGQFYIENGGNFFVAHEASTSAIAGFVGIRSSGKGEGVLKRLAVLTEHRGHRLGSSLVSAVVHWARTNNIRNITLSTGEHELARPIYLKAGFIDNGFDGKDHSMVLDVAI
jgi:GNAT superfamily N-acetyltransferase